MKRMRAIWTLATVLAVGGCAYNINTVPPADLAGIVPIVGSTLTLVDRTLNAPRTERNDTKPALADLQRAFEQSGVFSQVVIADHVPSHGFAIEMKGSVRSSSFYPDDIGPVGALIQIPLMAIVPWQSTTEFTETFDVYYQSKKLANYRIDFNSEGMVSWNPMFMLFGKPGGWRSESDNPFLASRHAGHVLAKMQQDGYLKPAL